MSHSYDIQLRHRDPNGTTTSVLHPNPPQRRSSSTQSLSLISRTMMMMMMMMMMMVLLLINNSNHFKVVAFQVNYRSTSSNSRIHPSPSILQSSTSTAIHFTSSHIQRLSKHRTVIELQQSTSPTSESPTSQQQQQQQSSSTTSPFDNSDPNIQFMIMNPNVPPTDEWEMDCYSRPIVMKDDNNKKLWQILITDSIGSFRYIHRLPSNQVNSKTVRQVVDNFIDVMSIKPNTIRFFRGAMFNMIQIALSEIPNVTSKPSRCTFALASWLEELYTDVYPNMEGYNPSMVSSNSNSPSFLDVRTPIKLPDALRGEKYAFVSLPLQEFLPSPDDTNDSSSIGINADNIGVGRLCPIPKSLFDAATTNTNTAADIFVQGVVILSSRAPALAAWLAGTEVVALQADLRKRILTMETDIDNQYLMAKLNDQQRMEAVAFEEGKDMLQGLHFISVQRTEDDDPEGFWLLRELPTGI